MARFFDRTAQRVAVKHVSMVDVVSEVRHDPRPPFTDVRRVSPAPRVIDNHEVEVDFVRPTRYEGIREPFWRATALDLVGLDCE